MAQARAAFAASFDRRLDDAADHDGAVA